MEYLYKNYKFINLIIKDNKTINSELTNKKYLLLFLIILVINIYLIFINMNNKILNHNYLEIQSQYIIKDDIIPIYQNSIHDY